MSELEAITGGTEAPTEAAPHTSSGSLVAASTAPFIVGIRQRDPPNHGIVAKLGPSIPTPSEGGGGWEEVTLPKRAAVLVWKGRGLLKLALSVLFDNFDTGAPVGPEYATLLAFWRPDKATTPPSILRLSASGDTIPYAGLDYVLSGLEWAEGAEANAAGERSQQILNLTFTEYRPDERLQTVEQAKKKGHTTTYEVKRDGELLGKIAERFHVKGGAKALGAAQHPPIKDPRHLKHGQKLIVPLP